MCAPLPFGGAAGHLLHLALFLSAGMSALWLRLGGCGLLARSALQLLPFQFVGDAFRVSHSILKLRELASAGLRELMNVLQFTSGMRNGEIVCRAVIRLSATVRTSRRVS